MFDKIVLGVAGVSLVGALSVGAGWGWALAFAVHGFHSVDALGGSCHRLVGE